MDKKPIRDLSPTKSVGKNEGFLNNHKLLEPNLKKAHDFNSYSEHIFKY